MLHGNCFTRENFGGILPPLGIPKPQLPHAHPDMQVNAAFAGMKELCLLNSAALCRCS